MKVIFYLLGWSLIVVSLVIPLAGLSGLIVFVSLPALFLVICGSLALSLGINSPLTFFNSLKLLFTKQKFPDERLKEVIRFLTDLRKFSWYLGIIGILIGLMLTLRFFDDPGKIGSGLSMAFLSSLYSIAFSELILFPMIQKVVKQTEEVSVEVFPIGILGLNVVGLAVCLLFLIFSIVKTPGEKADAISEGSFQFQNIQNAIRWIKSYEEAKKIALKERKPMMVDFYTDWCGWCEKLDKDVYSDPEIIKFSTNFVCVKVDAEKNEKLAERFSVSGYPTVLFLDWNGKEIERIVGYTEKKEFLEKMQKVPQLLNQQVAPKKTEG